MEVMFYHIYSCNRGRCKPGSVSLAETLGDVTGKYWTQIVGNVLSSIQLFWRPVCLPASPTREYLLAVKEVQFLVTALISLKLFQWRLPVLFTEFLFSVLWNWVEINLKEGNSLLKIFAIKTKTPTSILGHTKHKHKVNMLLWDCKVQKNKRISDTSYLPFPYPPWKPHIVGSL